MDRNLLILLSDEHNKGMLGVSGHEFVKTPNLDKLAKDGSFLKMLIVIPQYACLQELYSLQEDIMLK